MDIATVTGPLVDAVPLAVAKDHIKQDLDNDDASLIGAIAAATAYVEDALVARLITQTVKLTLPRFCGPTTPIPIKPVQSVTSIQYKEAAGQPLATWAANDWQLVKSRLPYGVAPVYGGSWPTVLPDFDAVEVTAVVGYGDDPESIPGNIRQALLLLIEHFNTYRADAVTGAIVSNFRLSADALIAPHRLYI